MKKLIKKGLFPVLTALLCLSLLLVGCSGEQPPEPINPGETSDPGQATEPGESDTTVGDGESSNTQESDTEESTTEQESEPATVTYTVTVTGSDGSLRQGAMIGVSKGGEELATAVTGTDGVASFELVPDMYEVAIKGLLGETYVADGCELTPDSTALAIRLYGLPGAGEEIYAYSPVADDHVAYDAKRVVEGSTVVTLNADDMTYYLFISARGGTFKLSLDESVAASIGYFGSTSYVLTESIVAEENNAILIDVYDDMVFNYAFVIGIKAEDAELTRCVLTVEYVSERETTEDELPWTDVAPEGELAQYTKGQGTYHTFDMEGDVVSLVYNESDGYYHVGTADGPLVLINLGNDSNYMDALTTVCNNMRLGVYVYGEDGKLLSKDSYNELIWAYHAVSDGGYYPLDRAMLDMLVAVGEYLGWYDASSPMYLFEGKVLTVENAHLFACVYLQ